MSWPVFWTKKTWRTRLLWPLSKVVSWEATRRLKNFNQLPPAKQTLAKVIVVGNLVVGGSGKTPFIIWLTRQLQARGLKVGIISRGYGGQSNSWPLLVTAESDPSQVGDEPVLLAKQLGCSIAVSPKRPEAIRLLNDTESLDVIISDDGLQHYALARDIEVVLIDSQRQFGNGLCLPAGPLREPLARLQHVNLCVWNGLDEQADFPISKDIQPFQYRMSLRPLRLRQVKNPEKVIAIRPDFSNDLPFNGEEVNTIAGIGNPNRFFETLEALGFDVCSKAFADHHDFQLKDFQVFGDEKRLLMTEKDAVKCFELAKRYQKDNWWYLEVAPSCDEALLTQVLKLLSTESLNE